MSRGENTESGEVEQFYALMENNGEQDAGILQLERKMISTGEHLTQKYRGKKGFSGSSEIRDVEESFENEWYFDGEVAVVSGRVYLADGIVRDDSKEDEDHDTMQEDGSIVFAKSPAEVVPKSWGDATQADDGSYWYFLENVKLKSCGIEVIPKFNDQGETIEIKIAYAFSAAEDEHDRPIFTVYPGDLWQHRYESPSDEEVLVRLRRSWPEQLGLIETLTRADAQTPLPLRLDMLCNRLQKELQDQNFRSLFERQVNRELSFNDILPYLVSVKNGISFFTGDDPFEDLDEEFWEYTKMKTPQTFQLYNPRFHISDHTDGTLRPSIFGVTYNDEYSDPEFVSFVTQNTTVFRPTWSGKSLASRVLVGKQSEEAKKQAIIASLLEESEISDEPVETLTDDEIRELARAALSQDDDSEEYVSNYENGKPDWVRKMELLKTELGRVMEDVRAAMKQRYDTYEEAERASREITEEISNRLTKSGLYIGHEVEVSGETAIRPRPVNDIPGVKLPEHLTVFGVSPEDPFVRTQYGDSFVGGAYGIHPFVGSRTDTEGNIDHYIVTPSLMVNLHPIKKQFSALVYQGASMVDVAMDFKGVAPLDGSASIIFRPLETYYRSTAAMKEMSQKYRRDPIVRKLNRLNDALAKEGPNEYIYLKNNAEAVRTVGSDIIRLREQGLSETAALNALEALLLERNVRVNGEVYFLENGVLGDERKIDEDKVVIGKIIDVTMKEDIFEGRPFIVMQYGPTVNYLPIDAINRFGF